MHLHNMHVSSIFTHINLQIRIESNQNESGIYPDALVCNGVRMLHVSFSRHVEQAITESTSIVKVYYTLHYVYS